MAGLTLLRTTQAPTRAITSAPGGSSPAGQPGVPTGITGWLNTGGGWWRAPDPNNPTYQVSFNPVSGAWDYSNPYTGQGVQANNLGGGMAPTSYQQAVELFNSVFGAPAASVNPPAPTPPGAPAASGASSTPAASPLDPLIAAFGSLLNRQPSTISIPSDTGAGASPTVIPSPYPIDTGSSGSSGTGLLLFVVAVLVIAYWWWHKHHHGHAQ